jgi:hypothetical protein
MRVEDTFGFLLGGWSLRRSIEDHRNGSRIDFSGTAEVVELAGERPGERAGVRPGRARYHEHGSVITPAHHGPAERTLLYDRSDAGLRVSFADGRPFIDLDLSSGSWRAEHPCVADLYELTFTVLDADRIEERWLVRGPRWDYEALTVWQRVSPA